MKAFFIYLSISVLLISLFSFYIINQIEIFKKPLLVNNENCVYHSGIIGAEDIVNWNNIGISCSDNRVNLWYNTEKFGVEKTENGKFYSIHPQSQAQIQPIVLENWPQDIALHPHGISLYKDQLFVINHGYSKGGERVEVFDISLNGDNKVLMKYNYSLILSEQLYGAYNDLVALNENEFFITTWIAIPHSVNGMHIKETIWLDIKRIVYAFFFKETYVYYCKIEEKKPICEKVEGSEGFMNNGIAYDSKKLIALARPLDKTVTLFELITRNNKKELKYLRDIHVGYVIDNIDYDKKSNSFYLGILGRIYDFFVEEKMAKEGEIKQNDEIISGSAQIKIMDNYTNMKSEIIIMQNKLVGVSVGCKLDEYILLGAPFHDGISICKI